MNTRLLILAVILCSLFGYLEWGTDQSNFLFQMEWDLFKKGFDDPSSVVHPFTIVPLLGQIFLLISLFLRKPNKVLIVMGIGSLGLLLGLLSIIGLIGSNWKIFVSSLPFLIFSYLLIRKSFRRNN